MAGQRLVNDNLARLLHQQLYQRMLSFCQQYTPELPGEPIVTQWLTRLFNGDNNLHIMVTLNSDYKITGHCVIDIQEMYGYRVVWCHQALADKDNATHLDEGAEYIDKLVQATNAYCALFVVTKHQKSLEKKYGYKTTRTIMMKHAAESTDNES